MTKSASSSPTSATVPEPVNPSSAASPPRKDTAENLEAGPAERIAAESGSVKNGVTGGSPTKEDRQVEALKAKIAAAEERIADVEKRLKEVEGQLKYVSESPDPAQTVKEHINLLHRYNEIKDVGMGLFGLIAESRGVRVKEVMEEFGMGDDA